MNSSICWKMQSWPFWNPCFFCSIYLGGVHPWFSQWWEVHVVTDVKKEVLNLLVLLEMNRKSLASLGLCLVFSNATEASWSSVQYYLHSSAGDPAKKCPEVFGVFGFFFIFYFSSFFWFTADCLLSPKILLTSCPSKIYCIYMETFIISIGIYQNCF